MRVRLAYLILVASLSGPVVAQTSNYGFSVPTTLDAQESATHIGGPTPAHLPDLGNLPAEERPRAALDFYAGCLVRHDRRPVEAVLAMYAASDKGQQRVAALSSDYCPTANPGLDPGLLRGALYRALFRADFAKRAPSLSTTPIVYRADSGADPAAAVYVSERQFADCVIRQDAANASALLLSATASTAEAEHLTALSTHFSSCLTAGAQATFSKAVLVGLLAETLYRSAKPAAG